MQIFINLKDLIAAGVFLAAILILSALMVYGHMARKIRSRRLDRRDEEAGHHEHNEHF